MFKNHDIIMLSSSRWDDDYSSSALSLAKEFAKHNRVFYIDHPFSVKDFFSKKNKTRIKPRIKALLFGKKSCRKINGFPANFTAVTPLLTLPVNWLKAGNLYYFLSFINDKILHLTLRKVIKMYSVKEYIFINVFDPFYLKTIPADIKPAKNIYITVDDISQEKYIARHGVHLEEEAIKKADLAFATSKELLRLTSAFSNHVSYLPNAADVTIFKKASSEIFARPEELKDIKGKVICYTGAVGSRINFKLLRETAVFHSNKTIVLVGPASPEDYKKEGLHKLSNIRFTGAKNIHQLPVYLQYADVAIIPFEYSLLTKSIYPLKINEYLAAGKPVVSTAFSKDITEFSDVAYIANSNSEFITLIDTAINENSREKKIERIKKAETNTWQNRISTFWKVVEKQAEAKYVES